MNDKLDWETHNVGTIARIDQHLVERIGNAFHFGACVLVIVIGSDQTTDVLVATRCCRCCRFLRIAVDFRSCRCCRRCSFCRNGCGTGWIGGQITIVHLSQPRKQDYATIAKDAMQKQLAGVVFALQFWYLEFAYFRQPSEKRKTYCIVLCNVQFNCYLG